MGKYGISLAGLEKSSRLHGVVTKTTKITDILLTTVMFVT
jgi:hypothetical protein